MRHPAAAGWVKDYSDLVPVLMNHYIMLQRNLIYTGITRAKKVLVMIGTKKALAYAVKNVTVTKRNRRPWMKQT